MKLVVNRDLFSRALARTQGVLSRKATLPVLSNVLLEVNDEGKLRVAATDLDVTYDGYLSCRSLESGRITVDGKRLYEVVRQLPGEEVDVSVNAEERMQSSNYWAHQQISILRYQILTGLNSSLLMACLSENLSKEQCFQFQRMNPGQISMGSTSAA